jgi:hypothetical protein
MGSVLCTISKVTSCLRLATTVFRTVRLQTVMKKNGSLLPLLSNASSKNSFRMGVFYLFTPIESIMGSFDWLSNTSFLKFSYSLSLNRHLAFTRVLFT